MKINFKQIHISNFLSIGDAVIELDDCGYTLVNGINQNPDDLAKSNGSGKSTIFEAISWVLTGETIRGSKDVTNIHGNDGALVELDFTVGTDSYKLIRTKDHSKYKTNLKIFINGEDKSGKGIADSKKLLAEYLPDLTSSLLGSVIVLGQGLPQRFTNNSPSGRKEVLEKLSKSDFMLQDLKARISNRLSILKTQLRECEDAALTINVKKQSMEEQIKNNTLILNNLRSDETIKQSIELLESAILDCNIKINTYNSDLTTLLEEQKIVNAEYTAKIQESNDEANQVRYQWEGRIKEVRDKYAEEEYTVNAKYNLVLDEIRNNWNTKKQGYDTDIAVLNTEIKNLNSKITELKNIKDICPTCGQKLPDVHKPDTSKLESELEVKNNNLEKLTKLIDAEGIEYTKSFNEKSEKLKEEVKTIQEKSAIELNDLQLKYTTDMQKGKDKYQTVLDGLYNKLTEVDTKISNVRQGLATFEPKKAGYESQLNALNNELTTLAATRKAANDGIEFAKNEIEKLNVEIVENSSQNLIINKHLEIVNKMNNVITRDFRGFLLINIIDFINRKAKEYSQEVFETDKIEFTLNGNNIDIKYDNKDYSNLSGGEKQKVDLIVQFAIRDMLCKYLDFSSNILVLDEICDNVDSVGAERLFNMISRKLTDVQSIFIVSHHTDFQIPVDRQITVIKGPDKISKITII